MLNVAVELKGFDEFMSKLSQCVSGGLYDAGFKKAVDQVRQTVIDGTPIGNAEEDEHPGLMKKSWKEPVYSGYGGNMTATVTNEVEYGMASNYGHTQQVDRYVPAINKRLIHEWVPGTYALETSLDEAEYQIDPIIRQEVLRLWNQKVDTEHRGKQLVRKLYYDKPGLELNEGDSYYG